MEINALKIRDILEEKAVSIANKIFSETWGEEVDNVDCLENEEIARVRSSFRTILNRLGIERRDYDHSYVSDLSKISKPEMVCIPDFTMKKECAVFDIPNHVAERILTLGHVPDVEVPRKKPEFPIVRASKNKTQYQNLKRIAPSEDNKRLVFEFENDTRFSWCVFDFKFYHTDTGKEFGESHFKNIVWGSETEYGRVVEIKPGHHRFFSYLRGKSEEGWAQNFFTILGKWIDEQVNRQRSQGSHKLFTKQINYLETLCKAEIIAPIESLAKNNFVQKMNLDRLCQKVIRGSRIVSFQEMREDNLDAWFFQHVGESAAPRYLRNDHHQNYGYNQNEDVYAGDENREYILGNYMDNYREFFKQGVPEWFRHVWDKYKFPLNTMGYGYNQFIQNVKTLNGFGYNVNSLLDYVFDKLPHQGIDQHVGRNIDEMQMILDYAKMSSEMDRDFDKYPRCLKMAHDIAMKNYKVKKSKVLCDKYEKIREDLKKLETKGEKYSVVVPESLAEIVREGTLLNHCVAQYIEGVVAGTYAILFLRDNDDLQSPLVTLQYQDGHVVQSRGQNNRSTTKEEQDEIDNFVQKMNKQKKLEVELAA
jgi:phosphoribosylaminoimidazole-succinocarboxamide synthase